MVWETAFYILRWKNIIPDDAFVSLTYLVLGGYFAANVMQGFQGSSKLTLEPRNG